MAFKPNVQPSENPSFKSTDARVLGITARYLLTSGNMHFLPRFYAEPRPLRPRGNGKFAAEDYTLHPQMYFEQYPWLPCVAHPPDDISDVDKHPFYPLWWDAPLKCWEATSAHVFTGHGHMAEDDWLVLRDVVRAIDHAAALAAYLRPPVTFSTTRTAMLAALERLRFLPMAKADFVLQLAQCQRMALDVDAMTKFLLTFAPRIRQKLVSYDVDQSLMGCFTNNPTVAETLHRAGVPYWLIRDTREVPVGTISVMAVTNDYATASYVHSEEYFAKHGANPTNMPFKTIGVYGHQVERIERTRTMGRMYSSLVQFEEGPQEYVSEDLKDLLSSSDIMARSKTPWRDPRARSPDIEGPYQQFSDGEQDEDVNYVYQPPQDSPTSPSPAPSSRASSIAPPSFAARRLLLSSLAPPAAAGTSHRSPSPGARSVDLSSSNASNTTSVLRNYRPAGVQKHYPKNQPRKQKTSTYLIAVAVHHLLTIHCRDLCSPGHQ